MRIILGYEINSKTDTLPDREYIYSVDSIYYMRVASITIPDGYTKILEEVDLDTTNKIVYARDIIQDVKDLYNKLINSKEIKAYKWSKELINSIELYIKALRAYPNARVI